MDLMRLVEEEEVGALMGIGNDVGGDLGDVDATVAVLTRAE